MLASDIEIDAARRWAPPPRHPYADPEQRAGRASPASDLCRRSCPAPRRGARLRRGGAGGGSLAATAVEMLTKARPSHALFHGWAPRTGGAVHVGDPEPLASGLSRMLASDVDAARRAGEVHAALFGPGAAGAGAGGPSATVRGRRRRRGRLPCPLTPRARAGAPPPESQEATYVLRPAPRRAGDRGLRAS
eukprot:tig00021014_g17095.t1